MPTRAPDKTGKGVFLDALGDLNMCDHYKVTEANQKLIPKILTLQFCMKWKIHIYHAGSSDHYMSIVQGRLIAGGTSDRRARQTCFFSAENTSLVPTEAEREHWKSTYHVKQTTARAGKRMASRAPSPTSKQHFHTTSDLQCSQWQGRIGCQDIASSSSSKR